MVEIIHGDCLEVMKVMLDNSVDSIVTDPPYGISFMNSKWDYNIPKVEVWKEALRVLKPGGHALVACGTRTQHRMAVNLEDAGFEIRDVVLYCYGSGFPKSLNIGKAVDKLQGNERDLISTTTRANHKNGAVYQWSSGNDTGISNYTKGTSPYEGWGTALKPAVEFWSLCRKPLSEPTIGTNVLKWGTGGINVDGCRVESRPSPSCERGKSKAPGESVGATGWKITASPASYNEQRAGEQLGRWPADLIHDGSDEVIGLFPNTKPTKPHSGDGEKLDTQNMGWGFRRMPCGLSDNGGSAARFFYCAKSSKSERNAGLEGFEKKQTPDGCIRSNPESARKYQTNSALRKNNHPCVKPISLMRYLCRLITPKGGTILDCFAGSGSTGIAAKLEGFNFIGIERDAEYCRIAAARIEAWRPDPQQELAI